VRLTSEHGESVPGFYQMFMRSSWWLIESSNMVCVCVRVENWVVHGILVDLTIKDGETG
jgi:hypothetical protein